MILIINSPGDVKFVLTDLEKTLLPYGPAIVTKALRDNGFKVKLVELRLQIKIIEQDIDYKETIKWL